jgi:hypothetical protein
MVYSVAERELVAHRVRVDDLRLEVVEQAHLGV